MLIETAIITAIKTAGPIVWNIAGLGAVYELCRIRKDNGKIHTVERIGSDEWKRILPFKWRYVPNNPRYFKWDIVEEEKK